jgi:hypothetical protein
MPEAEGFSALGFAYKGNAPLKFGIRRRPRRLVNPS